jgi:aminoglycoside phosphotransferase (APT) family kinase protein
MTSSTRDWRRLGFDIVRAVVLSHHGAGRAFRLDLRDGRTLKARLFTSPRWAAEVERLLAAPGARACPRPIERRGNVLISEFVPGVPLDERLVTATGSETRRWAREAGHLMARIHRGHPPRGRATAPAWYQRHLISRIRTLVRVGLITRDEGDRLIALGAPVHARGGLTHGDVCPENLVLTPAGSLVAIDEERLALRPFAYDLARSVNRWPLDAALERAFLKGYADGGGDASGYRRWRAFWVATALATSAGYRLKRAPGTLGPILSAIRQLAAGH